MIMSSGELHSIVYFSRRFAHESKAAPLNLEHMLEPCLYPAADHDVTAYLALFGVRFRNQWRESTTVADSQDIGLTWIYEVVFPQRPKRRAIACKFRFKIVFGATTFAVADAFFIHPE